MTEDWWLDVGDASPVIAEAKRILGEPVVDEVYTEGFAPRVRGFQALNGLVADGMIDERTLARMGLRRP